MTKRKEVDPWENLTDYDSATDTLEMYKSKYTFICMNHMSIKDRKIFVKKFIDGKGSIPTNVVIAKNFGVSSCRIAQLVRRSSYRYCNAIRHEEWSHKKVTKVYAECPKCDGHGRLFKFKGLKEITERCEFCHSWDTKISPDFGDVTCDMCNGEGRINIKDGFKYKNIVICKPNHK